MPVFTPLVDSLPSSVPFVGPETQERANGRKFKARLGANESAFGPSPKAIEAMQSVAGEVWKYGDPENHELTKALAEHYGVSTGNIAIGEGIDGLLGLVARMIVGANTPVVTSAGAYPTFNFHISGFGGQLITVPYRDDAEDIDGLLKAIIENKAPLAYFANPDNPMGSWNSGKAVADFVDRLPQDTLLVLDEAYSEFAPDDAIMPIDISEKRVLRTRTFSKAYGMAGARVGYAIGHKDMILAFNKVRNHFGVNRIAKAGAVAALADQSYLRSVIEQVHKSNTRIAAMARAHGLEPLPTATNFTTIDCMRDSDFARRVVAELAKRDVFIRMPFVEPQSRCIRISAGRDVDLDILEAVFSEALAAAT